MVTETSPEFPAKACSPMMVFLELRMVTEANELQLTNAQLAIESTEAGIVIDFKLLHPAKA
jgi:hypothetical protein